MKKLYFITILMAAFLLIGCQPTSKLIVQPATGEIKPSASGFFYSLPRTVIEVKLDLRHDIYIPGPYCQFAAQFLGIEGVQLERKEDWTIASESINSYLESDPDHIFYAGFTSGRPLIPELLTLTKNGLVFSPAATFASALKIPFDNSGKKDSVWYTDLSMEYFYLQKTDTFYKTVLKDSSFVKIPVYKKEEVQKTDEQKAKEAANSIIKLRKRRFKLLSGEYNFITEGAALEITVRELSKMEQEYISLFLGKHYTESHSYKTCITLSLKSEIQTLFRFSGEQGILPQDSKAGLPVTLNIVRENSNSSTEINVTSAENSLYFRIPENATFQLNLNNRSLTEKRIAVYQFGKIQVMPVIPGSMRHRWMR